MTELSSLVGIRQKLSKGTFNNSYAFVYEHPHLNAPKTILSSACLSSVSGHYNQNKTTKKFNPLTYFIDYPYGLLKREKGKREFSEEEYGFIHWLIHNSVWAPVFLTKNIEEIFNLGIVYDVSYPAKFVIQGAMLSRYPSEFQGFIDKWWEISGWVDQHLAIAIAHDIHFDDDTFTIRRDGTSNSNHQAWKTNEVGPHQLVKMMTDDADWAIQGMPPFSHDSRYRSMWHLWWKGTTSLVPESQRMRYPEGEKVVEKVWDSLRTYQRFPLGGLETFLKDTVELNHLEAWSEI